MAKRRADGPPACGADSPGTALRQVPALFRAVPWRRGAVNADVGGGPYGLASAYLGRRGVRNVVIDPGWQGERELRAAIASVSPRRADTVTLANTLNVMPDPEARARALQLAAHVLAPGGAAYVSVYEGDGSGRGARTTRGWQANRPLRAYLAEVRRWFGDVRVERGAIVARAPRRVDAPPIACAASLPNGAGDPATFDWPEEDDDVAGAAGCGGEPEDDGGDYPLTGPDRFDPLPLELPPDFTFYLGTHHAADLAASPDPLFLSRRALVLDPARKGSTAADWPDNDRQRKRLPVALAPWGIDSAGFTELHMHGCHHLPARQYAAEVCRYHAEVGQLRFAAVQDWMCESSALAVTGQDVDTHQRRTIESYMQLREIAPHLPWAPVLQGFAPGDHERHLAMYYRQGIDLRCAPVVGVGSVCRRQGMADADAIVRSLSGANLRLHLFGYKFSGLPQTLLWVRSADSLAWSMVARRQNIQMPGHDHSGPLTGELWQRGPGAAATLRRRRGAWRVKWGASGEETFSGASTARAALVDAGYSFVRKLWTCNNCLTWARLWRRNMLALALRSAREDTAARHYGHRTMTDAELGAHLAADPAEGLNPRDVTAGDYELSRLRMEAAAGVRIPREPQCEGEPRDGAPPCEPARYRRPEDPAPAWPPPPRVHVEPLAPGGEKRPWRSWSPGQRALDPGPADALDEARTRELADAAVEDVWEPGYLSELPLDDADLLYRRHLSEAEDSLPRSAAFGRFLAMLRRLPARRRGEALRAFREAFEAALWEACFAAAPGPDPSRPVDLAGRPWAHLFGEARHGGVDV